MNDNDNVGSPFPPRPEEGEKFGAPPPPQVEVRTMGSDIQSITKGEPMPVPETVLSPSSDKDPVFRPETQFDASQFGVEGPSGGKSKRLWVWISASVAVIVVVVVGYVVWPMIFGGIEETPPLPQVDGTTPPPTTEPPPPVIEVKEHHSFFSPSASVKTEVLLTSIDRASASAALQSVSANKLANGTLQEVAILDQNRSQVPFLNYIKNFVTTLASDQMTPWFEDDFTAFLYYDGSGVWPGYIAKVKNAVNLDEVRANISVIEGSELARFFLMDPGTFGQFKAGQVNGQATRYAVGSMGSAAFNYGVIGNYLIISTSYNGLKASLPLLGL